MTVAPVITSAGILAPSFADVLAYLKAGAQSIYGSDIYIESDSQDGQILSIFANAINDTNNACVATYNSYSPATAIGAALSNAVKINGLRRLVPSQSTAVITIVGQNGTTITNGIVGDNLGLNTKWALPATVNIPGSGTIDVTATCTDPGAIAAAANSLTQILTPTRGWQTANNAASASPGAPTEDDATLRNRQAISTAQPAETPFDSILAEIENVAGVVRAAGYENDTDTTDGNGIPSHSVSFVVQGGTTTDIAAAIGLKKAPGTGTYGSTSVPWVDPKGISKTINYFVLATVPIYVEVDITALAGYSSSTTALIQSAVAAYINALAIGGDVYQTKLISAANLFGDAATSALGLTQAQLDAISATFNLTNLKLGTAPAPSGTATIPIAFNAAAACVVANVNVVVT